MSKSELMFFLPRAVTIYTPNFLCCAFLEDSGNSCDLYSFMELAHKLNPDLTEEQLIPLAEQELRDYASQSFLRLAQEFHPDWTDDQLIPLAEQALNRKRKIIAHWRSLN